MTIDKDEGKFHIKHEIEQNPKCPHINLKAVNLVQVYFRWHIILSAQDCPINILHFFSKPKISNLKNILVFAFVVKYILELDIPVQETHFMHMLQSQNNLA